MSLADVALGSNLGPREAIFEGALGRLERVPGVQVVARSGWVTTPAMGPTQPAFLNGVVRLSTTLSPEALLALLARLERLAGRVPHGRRWGPRVLDLDLLTYGTRRLSRRRLVLPHPGRSRAFLAAPLAELDAA